MSNTEALRKALEFIQKHCVNIIRTNSRDRDDWVVDVAYIGKVASDALAQPAAMCACKDRPAADCPGEWEPGCDLVANAAHVVVAQPAASGEPVPLAAELALMASAADADGDDYTPALSLRAPDARIPVGLARNHSAESAWRVGWMRGWMEARRTADAQPAPRLKWMKAPRRTEWGAGMMEALIALGADETLRLHAHSDALPMADALLSAQPAPAPESQPLTSTGVASQIQANVRDNAQPAPARVPLTDERLNSAGLDYALADSFSSGKAEWVAQDIADAFKAGARAAERYYAAAPTAQQEPKP